MNTENILHINKLFRLQFEAAQDAYVLLFPEGMIKLNPSAAEILKLVNAKRTATDICEELRAKFANAPDDLEQDVLEFLQHALEKNWLVYGNE